MDIQIVNESIGDAARIHEVTVQAFLNAVHSSHTEQFIVDALRRAGALTISMVAKAKEEIVGHAAISPVVLSTGSTGWFGLGPVSVLPDYQGRGVGSGLVKGALNALEAMGASGCVVLGDPGFYGRFGFTVVNGLVYPGVPAEYFLGLSFTGEVPQGAVTYHDAFSAAS